MTETSWRKAALVAGITLAREVFAKRPDPSDTHIGENELALMLAVAFELGAETADRFRTHGGKK